MTDNIIEANNTNNANNENDTNYFNCIDQFIKDPTYTQHEDVVTKYWDKIDLTKLIKESDKNKKHWSMIDGPPFPSGAPHNGHVAIGSNKSTICNAQGMRGYKSTCVPGWDCHGVPIEAKVTSLYNLSTEDIDVMGCAKFNEMCDQTITSVANCWTPLNKQLGRLADYESAYMTRDLNYMESVIAIFKILWEKDLIYDGNKVMAYSPKLRTSLSNFEAGQNYIDVTTKSIYVRFKCAEQHKLLFDFSAECKSQNHTPSPSIYFVAWTTTPWTLPSNMALCVNPNTVYVAIKSIFPSDENTDTFYIVSKSSIANLVGKKQVKKVKILTEFTGKSLEHIKYEPLFDCMQKIDDKLGRTNDKAFCVLCDTYVKDEGIGTGIVHQAPAFGEDDYRVCETNGIVDNITVSDYCPLDQDCAFTSDVPFLANNFAIDTDEIIRNMLGKEVVKVLPYKHSYPHCYRTDAPLIYKTVQSIFINVSSMTKRLLGVNDTINWHPKEIGKNRFANWLANSKDWAVSRTRKYGAPIPIWVNEQDPTDKICIGSIAELEKLSGVRVDNLHKHIVDKIIIEKDNKTYRRIPDILDCWFESGAAPFAKIHYPFNKEASAELESRDFLCDFVCEGLDQTRGWFYTMLVLSVAVLNRAPFRNVACMGLVMNITGEKLSKRLKNYTDPAELIEKFGADIVRLYFVRSPLMKAEPLYFSQDAMTRLKQRMVPYYNAFRYLIEHTMSYKSKHSSLPENFDILNNLKSSDLHDNIMDKWLINRTILLGQQVNALISEYKIGTAADKLIESIDGLTNWYIKFNRTRLNGAHGKLEQCNSLSVLYSVLLTYTQLWAPFCPFFSEYAFQKLKTVCIAKNMNKYESVLLSEYPSFTDVKVDVEVLNCMKDLRRICLMVRNIRDTSENHRSQMVPFKMCDILHADQKYLINLSKYMKVIQDELNIYNFNLKPLSNETDIEIVFNNKLIGQTFRKESIAFKNQITNTNQNDLSNHFKGKINLKIGKLSLSYPNNYYSLKLVPKSDKSNSKYMRIDGDLMIKVNPEFDSILNLTYQHRRLRALIQKSRKEMAIHPWDQIIVMLDSKFLNVNLGIEEIEHFLQSMAQFKNKIQILSTSFNEEDLNKYPIGLTKTEYATIYVSKFQWNTIDNKSTEGYVGVYCKTKQYI